MSLASKVDQGLGKRADRRPWCIFSLWEAWGTELRIWEPGEAPQKKDEEQASVGQGSVVVANAGGLSAWRICKYKHMGENGSLVCYRHRMRYMYRKHLTK